jgi:hypothetical protein
MRPGYEGTGPCYAEKRCGLLTEPTDHVAHLTAYLGAVRSSLFGGFDIEWSPPARA